MITKNTDEEKSDNAKKAKIHKTSKHRGIDHNQHSIITARAGSYRECKHTHGLQAPNTDIERKKTTEDKNRNRGMAVLHVNHIQQAPSVSHI